MVLGEARQQLAQARADAELHSENLLALLAIRLVESDVLVLRVDRGDQVGRVVDDAREQRVRAAQCLFGAVSFGDLPRQGRGGVLAFRLATGL